MKKCKLFFRFDKEERWLERMAAAGWLLCRHGILYSFERIAPAAHTVKIDYRDFRSEKDYQDYCALFEDSGWRRIAGSRHSGTQYFLKIREGAADDIFSDGRSRAGRYKRMSHAWLTAATVLIPLVVTLQCGEGGTWQNLAAPREWYITPGLWERTGIDFWWSFLFETPFALMRGLGLLVPLCLMLFYLAFALKSWMLYRAEIAGDHSRRG